MSVHLINPSQISFGTSVITPRWLYVLAAATPSSCGAPLIVDETLDRLDDCSIATGDVVGIGIHSGNALRGYEIGRTARARGATVVYGGIHATLYPDEPFQYGGAHAVVRGDGDLAWGEVLHDSQSGSLRRVYEGGRIDGGTFKSARWDLLPPDRYMWASVQTVRGCPKHCSFCSVWRTDGQKPRSRTANATVQEIVELRRLGFRFVVLADDNFYPVSMEDLRLATRQGNTQRVQELQAIREERFELMRQLADLPKDMVFFTQITMEAAEDTEFLDAMRKAKIRGALVGVEAVTPQGLKDIYKDFNLSGENLVERLRTFRKHGVFVLGSFIFGLPSDRLETFSATMDVAQRADLVFAQFLTLTPFPGTLDFARWDASYAPLADPARASAEDFFSPSGDVGGADTAGHASDLGPLLLASDDLAPRACGEVDQGATCVCPDLKTLSPDVCEHRNRHRQRESRALAALGALDGEAVPTLVHGQADAGAQGTCRRIGRSCPTRAAILMTDRAGI